MSSTTLIYFSLAHKSTVQFSNFSGYFVFRMAHLRFPNNVPHQEFPIIKYTLTYSNCIVSRIEWLVGWLVVFHFTSPTCRHACIRFPLAQLYHRRHPPNTMQSKRGREKGRESLQGKIIFCDKCVIIHLCWCGKCARASSPKRKSFLCACCRQLCVWL